MKACEQESSRDGKNPGEMPGQEERSVGSGTGRSPARIAALLVLTVIAVAMAIRASVASIPLERDEGEFAYGAQLLLQGILPWTGVYSMKFPGIYGAYSVLLTLFGQTQTGIHVGLAIANLLTVILLFILGRDLVDSEAGLVAAGTYAVLSLAPGVLGVMAHATHFVVLFAVFGIVLLFRALKNERSLLLALSGILIGISVTMKQHGLCFVMFGAAYIVTWSLYKRALFGSSLRKLSIFCCGSASSMQVQAFDLP